MTRFPNVAWIAMLLAAMPALQGCLATKLVTVPVKVAYGTGKLAVKGTAAAVRAVVPDDEDETAQEDADAPRDPPPEPSQPR